MPQGYGRDTRLNLVCPECPRNVPCSTVPLFFKLRMSAVHSWGTHGCHLPYALSRHSRSQRFLLPLSSLLTHCCYLEHSLWHPHGGISVLRVGVSPSHSSVNTWGQTPALTHPQFLSQSPGQMRRLQELGYSTSTF